MRKTNSTNTINQQQLIRACGMAHTLSVIGGRWKSSILCRLSDGPVRYGKLKTSIEGISERMLVAQLKELEKDGIVERHVYAEVPTGRIQPDIAGTCDETHVRHDVRLGNDASRNNTSAEPRINRPGTIRFAYM